MVEKNKFDCEVVICGGGPVGLCLSLLLTRAGFDVVVLEKEAAIEEDLRASTFHPPTLDMLETLGISEKLVAQGLVCPHWQIRLHPDGDRAVFDLSVLEKDTKHPFRLQCEQWKLSVALAYALTEEKKADRRFGTEVTGFEQDENGVTVLTRSAEGEEGTLRARFLVGADGARSIVRKTLGIEFGGLTYPETTLLVTTHFPFEEHLEGISNVSYCWKDDGNFSLLKVPGRWRVSIYPKEDLPIEDQLTPEAVERSLQEIVPRAETYEVIEKRPYRVHQRIVENYVHGRVLLVGDAAHLNSPSGGMGLNGGIHDAFELSAALSAILKGEADLDGLSLYDRRRRPIARDQILAQADANRARMRERSPERRREILAGLQKITGDREALHAHVLKSSMIEGLRMSASIV
ncbi:FAD-dependent oxidoreductase [Neorhizobium alkalisoli]|uniref:3-(3-hydroxy-phenyl)propionate hydroxylase n=1 Tax=Neorhizobium alkalisoli TaxID=528178 RepID=A0A561QGC8_9HYPH|nr:FAD-dependent monooxygenase [Neorhizobium alkalisoli]TWF49404.1 3-(3-hydroxy-phenyl)propionate hydroxylase [Neorhizobium alkalisoli]